MIGYILRKLIALLATFLVAAALIFWLLSFAPAAPDAPMSLGFADWLRTLITGDFGASGSSLGAALGVTLPLCLIAIVLSVAVSLPLGYAAAQRRGALLDRMLMAVARVGVALPSFWLGMVLVLLFAVLLRWLPPGGFVPWQDNPLAALGSLILPAFALALPQAAVLARATRDALVEVQQADFIRAAQARGLTRHEAIRRHGLRNSLLAVLAILGASLAALIAGAVIVENVFYLPGLGRLIFDAINLRDVALVRSSVAILVLLLIGTMFLADLLVGWVDPRRRVRRRE